jgi:hypothetical protein
MKFWCFVWKLENLKKWDFSYVKNPKSILFISKMREKWHFLSKTKEKRHFYVKTGNSFKIPEKNKHKIRTAKQKTGPKNASKFKCVKIPLISPIFLLTLNFAFKISLSPPFFHVNKANFEHPKTDHPKSHQNWAYIWKQGIFVCKFHSFSVSQFWLHKFW